jgi:acetyl-CoA carboxylase biotin carboxyl carrier protein
MPERGIGGWCGLDRRSPTIMESRDIKALLNLMREYALVELEIEDKRGKIRLVRGDLTPAVAQAAPAASPAPMAAGALSRPEISAPNQSDSNGSASAAPPILADHQQLVTSPMVGTFYRAASPGADPFVEEGDHVRKSQPLCIIEAMKMMNEIEAENAGRVVRILCDNGQPVEYGQPLIILEAA